MGWKWSKCVIALFVCELYSVHLYTLQANNYNHQMMITPELNAFGVGFGFERWLHHGALRLSQVLRSWLI